MPRRLFSNFLSFYLFFFLFYFLSLFFLSFLFPLGPLSFLAPPLLLFRDFGVILRSTIMRIQLEPV